MLVPFWMAKAEGGGTKIKELFLSFYPSISGCEWRRGGSEKRGEEEEDQCMKEERSWWI